MSFRTACYAGGRSGARRLERSGEVGGDQPQLGQGYRRIKGDIGRNGLGEDETDEVADEMEDALSAEMILAVRAAAGRRPMIHHQWTRPQ